MRIRSCRMLSIRIIRMKNLVLVLLVVVYSIVIMLVIKISILRRRSSSDGIVMMSNTLHFMPLIQFYV